MWPSRMPCGSSERWSRHIAAERDVVDALHEYEIGMRDYGFRAVRNSLKAMRQTVTDSTLTLVFSRTMLRDQRIAVRQAEDGEAAGRGMIVDI